jgi:hypothetical protein
VTGLVQFALQHLGVDLWDGQVDVLARWATSGKRRAVFRLGRRSGKGLLAAVAAIYNAVLPNYDAFLRPGETRFVLVVATREQQAREQIRVVRELLAAAPDADLAALVDVGASTADEVVFRSGVIVRALPCSSRSSRGLPASLVIFDEAAHFLTDTDGPAAFRSVWRALTPSTAQFGAMGYVLVTSTPWGAQGPFYELATAAEAGTDPDTFAIHRPTWAMNPHITRESLASEFLTDPEGAASEYAAEFVSGLGAFLDPGEVTACVRPGVAVLPPSAEVSYAAAIDPAFAADAFALGIAHRGAEAVVVDGVWTWRRAGFESTLDQVADVARQYRVRTVRTDQFSAQAVVEGLRRRGLDCTPIAWDAAGKWQAYSRLKALIRTRGLSLPDDDGLRGELVGLEARPLPSGLTRIAARGSGHDDRASVVAALVDELAGGRGSRSQVEEDAVFGFWRCPHGHAWRWEPGRLSPAGCGCVAPAEDPTLPVLGLEGTPELPAQVPEQVPVIEPPEAGAADLTAEGFQPWGEDVSGVYRWVRQDGSRPPEYRQGPRPRAEEIG